MKKSIKIIISLSILLSVLISLTPLITPVGEVSACCERTISGAWCQNTEEINCDENYLSVPTSCEATGYCKLGVCYDSNDGTCMENTPKQVCNEDGGVWESAELEDVAQCTLGCCLLSDQAAFVTQTRCSRLSSLYGLETEFRTDISSEISCIASAEPNVMGACVYEEEFSNKCQFITKETCQGMEGAEFHEGYLCSDESLGTICGQSEETTCVEGEDQVYFLDTCGNLANIYDANRQDDDTYWSKIVSISESCGYGEGNANSATCGSCDYFLGSTCKKYKNSEDKVKPNYGNNICRNLACEYDGKTYEHGETWCAAALGTEVITDYEETTDASKYNLPGSRYFRLMCYDNEVMVEPCADYRQEVCYQSEVNTFTAAGCIANMWQDCYGITDQEDCVNTDKRDCQWVPGYCILKNEEGECLALDGKGGSATASCIPKYSPGFDFWNTESESTSICQSYGSQQCIVNYTADWDVWGLLNQEEACEENCECLEDSWADTQNQFCVAIGDCGSKENYIGRPGYTEAKDNIVIGEIQDVGGEVEK